MDQVKKAAVDMIASQIQRARGSKGYFPREAFHEAYGMLRMAYAADLIDFNTFMQYNEAIITNGINNPEYFN